LPHEDSEAVGGIDCGHLEVIAAMSALYKKCGPRTLGDSLLASDEARYLVV
jgi:hypothetical protein